MALSCTLLNGIFPVTVGLVRERSILTNFALHLHNLEFDF